MATRGGVIIHCTYTIFLYKPINVFSVCIEHFKQMFLSVTTNWNLEHVC